MRAVTLLPLLLLACEEGATWSTAFDTTDLGDLSSVWGNGPDDVYVVGGTPADAGGQSTVHHFDGTSWSALDVPQAGTLVWCYGFGADDVWAVGIDGLVLHYDGTDWAQLDPGVDEDLWGVFGFATDDLWIVGGDTAGADPVILHWDGTDFTPHALADDDNPTGARALFKVWGIDDTLFAVGASGLIVRWDGTAWTRTGAGPEADQDFVSLWGNAPDNLVAVGGRTGGRVSRWDGTAWTTTKHATIPGLNAVFMDEDGTAHIGGQRGYLARLEDGSDELVVETETATALDVHAIWGDGERHYGVGGRFFSPHEGVALVRE